jgi:uncharacterized membrane protein YraQ (UPF0718 family)
VDTPFVAKVEDFFLFFTSILFEALPFIVLGAVLSGILEEFLPQRLVGRILPRNRFLSICLGGLLGLIFPMCECGIIPIMRRLLRKGFPLSCCVAYLLAGPVINVVVLGATAVAFSGMDQLKEANGQLSYQMGSFWMTFLRATGVYIIAVTTGLLVDRLHARDGNKLLMPLAMPDPNASDEDDEVGPRRPTARRLANVSETALHDFVDITAFLVLGALLSAGLRQIIDPETIARWSRDNPIAAIAVMMGLAVPLCLCSEADAFIAASFAFLRPSAKLAFLVLGPMFDLKLYLMYTRVFRFKLRHWIFASVIIQTFIYAVIVHYLWEHYAPLKLFPPPGSTTP